MGSAESALLNAQAPIDEITVVSERIEGADPILERLRALKIAEPILQPSVPSENSLTDILVRKPPSSSASVDTRVQKTPRSARCSQARKNKVKMESDARGNLNPKVLLELFSMYRDWQEEKVKRISDKQVEIENKIDIADALAVKLLQRFNYSVSAMRTTAQNLSEVHTLQVEVGELKGRLTQVISSCDALCKRISAEGPETLQSSVRSFSAGDLEPDHCAPSEKTSSPA